MKIDDSLKDTDSAPEVVLRQALRSVPSLHIEAIASVDTQPGAVRRVAVRIEVSGRARDLDCAILDNGQPRYVREAALALAQASAVGPFRAASCVIAPHLGRQARELCVESGLSYLDFDGNCQLAFEGVYIERTMPASERSVRRAMRPAFSPKAARVLHVLLRDPTREWRVEALADAARVSTGQVSNVRRWLIDQEWAALGADGLRLTNTVSLLQHWRSIHEPLAGKRLTFKTRLDGLALRDGVTDALRKANANGSAMLASFSAAQWHEPMPGGEFLYSDKIVFYADAAGLKQLMRRLELHPAGTDENVVVVHPKNPDVFGLTFEPAPDVLCSNSVLTFLDLATPQAAREMAQRITVVPGPKHAGRRNRQATGADGREEE
jgi:hypothetical protein